MHSFMNSVNRKTKLKLDPSFHLFRPQTSLETTYTIVVHSLIFLPDLSK